MVVPALAKLKMDGSAQPILMISQVFALKFAVTALTTGNLIATMETSDGVTGEVRISINFL